VTTLPVVLLASFRDDEAPGLPPPSSHARVLRLERLKAADIGALSEAMIGARGRRPELIRLLDRETEGLPFFIVEVVRSLAEGASGLGRVAQGPLPERVLAGGIQRLVRRRLDRVPADAVRVLESAAIIGRVVDAGLLARLHPTLAFDEWIGICAGASVLELRDQSWQFRHDKLREQLLADLAPEALKNAHRDVALAIEAVHPDGDQHVTALAHHWSGAGDATREYGYARRAGELALQTGACREAVRHFGRSLEILRDQGEPARRSAVRRSGWRSFVDPNTRLDPASRTFELGVVEARLAEAQFRPGRAEPLPRPLHALARVLRVPGAAGRAARHARDRARDRRALRSSRRSVSARGTSRRRGACRCRWPPSTCGSPRSSSTRSSSRHSPGRWCVS